jgi:hypothetical protein
VALQGFGIDLGDGPLYGIVVVKLDPLGNVLFAKALSLDMGWAGMALGPAGDIVVASDDGSAIVVKRLDGAGNETLSLSFPAESAVASAVGVDLSGNIVITGDFHQVDFGGGPLVALANNQDCFIAKLDSSGSLLWAKQTGSNGGTFARTVSIDGDGNVVLAGIFSSVINLGGVPLNGASGANLFAVRLDPSGTLVFAKGFAGGNGAEARAAVDAAGNVLMTGTFTGNIDLGGGPLAGASYASMFVAKLTAAGNHVFSRSLGGTATQTAGGVAAANDGQVMVVGGLQGATDFGAGLLQSAGQNDAFLALFGANGVPIAAQRYGDSNEQVAGFVAPDPAGVPVVVGYFAGAIDFGQGPLVQSGTFDTFVARVSQL